MENDDVTLWSNILGRDHDHVKKERGRKRGKEESRKEGREGGKVKRDTHKLKAPLTLPSCLFSCSAC